MLPTTGPAIEAADGGNWGGSAPQKAYGEAQGLQPTPPAAAHVPTPTPVGPAGAQGAMFTDAALLGVRSLRRLRAAVDTAAARRPSPIKTILVGVGCAAVALILLALVMAAVVGELSEGEEAPPWVGAVGAISMLAGLILGPVIYRRRFAAKARSEAARAEGELDEAVDEFCRRHPAVLELVGQPQRLKDRAALNDLESAILRPRSAAELAARTGVGVQAGALPSTRRAATGEGLRVRGKQFGLLRQGILISDGEIAVVQGPLTAMGWLGILFFGGLGAIYRNLRGWPQRAWDALERCDMDALRTLPAVVAFGPIDCVETVSFNSSRCRMHIVLNKHMCTRRSGAERGVMMSVDPQDISDAREMVSVLYH